MTKKYYKFINMKLISVFLIKTLVLLIFPLSFINSQTDKVTTEKKLTQRQDILTYTKKMKKHEGYFDFYYDENKGKIFLEVTNLNEEFLYVNALTSGIGSNDIGLDRGQIGKERIVKFEKYGNKLFLIQPNYRYRATSDNPDEIRSVEEAFAKSILGGFEIKIKETNKYLIDITNFLLRDSHNISGRLKRAQQGTYKIDKLRSAIYVKGLFNFPKNSEFEAILTFEGTPQGQWISSVTPSPNAVTVKTHHSFIELPDTQYTPRKFDPRSGFSYISYQDYAVPIEEPLTQRFIVRHRLQKKNLNTDISEATDPIIYYVDRGAPEPIRSALIEGASWWNQAFESIGYKNAFQVKIMPEGAHPLDIRYNVIQWVHRSTRGWSYGRGVIDPRTGELIKGHVSLGSLRVRQDFLIATGILQPYKTGKENSDMMTKMALERLKQLSAHEVGHTLGLAHNFAASTNNRASVMDYPHPYVSMNKDGKINLDNAYDNKIGVWDKVTIAYGYSEFSEGENQEKLKEILNKAFENNLKFITDQDARPASGAHISAHLWDNGMDATQELDRMMKIRRKILDDFSENVIKTGTPMSSIEEVLVPMYLFHRYQLEATSKIIGGLDYTYSLKGEGNNVSFKTVPKEIQMKALDALLNTVRPEQLKLREELLNKIHPRAFGYPRTRETFQSKTGVAYDFFATVETAASLPFKFILNVERANRILMLHARNNEQLSFKQILDQIIDVVWKTPSKQPLDRSIERIVEMEMLEHLFRLLKNDKAYEEIKAIGYYALKEIKQYAQQRESSTKNIEKIYNQYTKEKINRFLNDPKKYILKKEIKAPDGSPIGSCSIH